MSVCRLQDYLKSYQNLLTLRTFMIYKRYTFISVSTKAIFHLLAHQSICTWHKGTKMTSITLLLLYFSLHLHRHQHCIIGFINV